MAQTFPLSILGTMLVTAALCAQTRVEVKNAEGKTIGTALFTPASDVAVEIGVRIDLDVKELPPGEHAVHIHAKALCEGPTFESAGPHFNPEKKSHGDNNALGPHAGDLKNITVGTDGTAKITLSATKVSLKKDAPNSLFQDGGTSLVIHEKADDYRTDPSGNAGARIACGVIRAPEGTN